MAKIHKTMRGKTVNMDTLRIKNEKEIALGNMNVNAGGDILGPGGVIIKDRNQRIRDDSALHTMVPGKAPVSKGKPKEVRKTAAVEAKEIAEKEAEQILADADLEIDESAPKGDLAATMAKAPKKKTSTKKKA